MYLALAERLEVTKSPADPEVERAYTRAHELCRQTGDTSRLNQVLIGLFSVYFFRAALPQALELAERLLSRAQRQNDPTLQLLVSRFMGFTLLHAGEIVPARARFAQGMAVYDLRLHPQQQHYDPLFYDAAARCRVQEAIALWHLGYTDQALARGQEALSLAQKVSRPYGLAQILVNIAGIHQFRYEVQAVQERAEMAITLCREYGFAQSQWLVTGTHLRGWAVAMQDQVEEGIAQMRQSLDAWRAMRIEQGRPHFLVLLAEAYGKAGQIE
ncbi:MAG: hypothetical protein O7G88_06475, partial [bacterium]|nr:hypothetical protein [bacterium]